MTIGDRGCVPSLGSFTATTASTGTAQAASASSAATAWVIGWQSVVATAAAQNTDFPLLMYYLCSGYGTCCTTNNCNNAYTIKLNQFNLIVLILSGLISKIYF